MIDASGIVNAVREADKTPHDEDAEMERWRLMYEGMEFWDDVGVGSQGQKTRDGALQEDGRVQKSAMRCCQEDGLQGDYHQMGGHLQGR